MSEAPAAENSADVNSDPGTEDGSVRGERGIPAVNRARSIQSRAGSFLAMGLMCALALALLVWYYAHAWKRPAQVHEEAVAATANRAKGDGALPALGKIQQPIYPSGTAEADRSALDSIFGPKPPLPEGATPSWADSRHAEKEDGIPTVVVRGTKGKTAPSALERRLSGPVLTSVEEEAQKANGVPASVVSADSSISTAESRSTALVSARVLATQRWLLPTGAFIDCTLETAIDSTLPGRTTCITATDTFGADGEIVLLERGTKLIGETRGQVQRGQSRIFVVWTEARTPTGVIVPLESPGTDELGRAGLPGQVNRHFWNRFGAALLISIVDGAVQAAAQSSRDGDTLVLNPSGSKDIATEVLKSTINIPPTVIKHHGDRIQVLVARDIDFRRVYELRAAAVGD